MINHFRTLLVNRLPVPSEIYEEYIPHNFSVLNVNSVRGLSPLRQILYAEVSPQALPDKTYVNYCTAQYLTALAATDLRDFPQKLDPRITYDPYKLLSNPAIDGFGFAPSVDYVVIGSLPDPDKTGKTNYSWDIRVATNTVTVTQLTPVESVITSAYAEVNGLSGLLNLPGTDVSIRIFNGANKAYMLEAYAKPRQQIVDVWNKLQALPGEVWQSLFDAGHDEELKKVLPSLKNTWESHPEMLFRFSSVLVALVYQTNKLWLESITS